MRASGVCGLQARDWPIGATRSEPLATISVSVLSCSPSYICSRQLGPRCVCHPHIHPPFSCSRGEIAHCLSLPSIKIPPGIQEDLLQSRNEDVSPSGNSRISAGPGLCMPREKTQLTVPSRSIQQSGALLGTASSSVWGKEGSICGGGGAGKHDNKEVVTLSSEKREQVF